jgi:hypothetical protein
MPRVVALFPERWPGGFLPVDLILEELWERGPPISERALRYALAKAVRLGHLTVVKGTDRGAVYGLASYAEANSGLVNRIRREPLRMLQRQDPSVESKAVRRWIRADGLRGMHDLRPGHKCIPCGNLPHRDPIDPIAAERNRWESTGMKLARHRSSVA